MDSNMGKSVNKQTDIPRARNVTNEELKGHIQQLIHSLGLIRGPKVDFTDL